MNDNLPPTRNEALELGLKHYFTGKPCKRGHIAKRLACNFNCVECAADLFDREKHLLAEARYREKKKDEINKAARDARAQEPQRFRNYGSRWRDKNRDYIKEKSRKAYQENPEPAKQAWRTRRALIIGAEGSHTPEDVERIHSEQGYCCAVCGVSTVESKHIDHKTPLSKGGSNWPSNLQILCPMCNRGKWYKTDEEFRDLYARGLTASNTNRRPDDVAA